MGLAQAKKGGAHVGTTGAVGPDSLKILVANVLALLGLDPGINVGDNARNFADEKNNGTQIEDLFGHLAVESADEGAHLDHPNHHAQQGEDRAELVSPERVERNAHRLAELHVAPLHVADTHRPEIYIVAIRGDTAKISRGLQEEFGAW